MPQAKKAAVREILDDETASRLDFLHVRTLAYSVPGEMDQLQSVMDEASETPKSASKDARARAGLHVGVGLWIMRKYAEAIDILDTLDRHKDGTYFLALCQTETADYPAAIKNFKKAATAGEAEALRRADKPDRARARLDEFRKSHKNKAELHFIEGRLADDALEYEQAMDAYEVALERNPQHTGALFRLAYLNDLRGNDDAAIDYYEKAAAIRPLRQNVLMNLGVLYEDQGQFQKAAQLYDTVLAALPTDSRARLHRKDVQASFRMYHDEAAEQHETRLAALLKTYLAEFELSSRCRAFLEKMDVRTFGDLARLTEDEVRNSKNFGEASVGELRALLQAKGLDFGLGRDEAASPAAGPTPDQSEALATPIEGLNLAVRSRKAMTTLGIQTLGHLIQKSEKDLLQCQNFGQTSLVEVKAKLADYGLTLKPKEE